MSELTTQKPYQKPVIGATITDLKDVPKEIRDTAVVRAAPKNHKGEILVGDNGKQLLPQLRSAKENGSYRGPVVLNSDNYLVQAVGEKRNFLIVHDKSNLQLQGNALPTMDAEKRLNGFNIQVHYTGREAKAYPYSPEREAEKRRQARDERAAQAPAALTKAQLAQNAFAYAQTIKNARSREAFLNHIYQLSSQSFQKPAPQQQVQAPAKEQAQPEQSR